MQAKNWNKVVPIGSRVRYYPIKGEVEGSRETVTRSEAWELGHGAAVVKIKGIAGGVSLDHLELLEVKQ